MECDASSGYFFGLELPRLRCWHRVPAHRPSLERVLLPKFDDMSTPGGIMGRRLALRGVAVAATVVLGYVGGSLYAASAEDKPERESVPANVESYGPLEPFRKLGNGGTVGNWRIDTPINERPDYVETRLADGTKGYLKLSDISDGMPPPDPTDAGKVQDVTREMAEARRRQKEVMVQPNAAGEVWAPVYGEDGTTILGKRLMNPDADNRAD